MHVISSPTNLTFLHSFIYSSRKYIKDMSCARSSAKIEAMKGLFLIFVSTHSIDIC